MDGRCKNHLLRLSARKSGRQKPNYHLQRRQILTGISSADFGTFLPGQNRMENVLLQKM